MKNILIIAVHPDDETLGCGGTLLKHKNNGDKIYWLILTKANPKITAIADIENLQENYVKKIASLYQFDDWLHLPYLTTELDQYPIGMLIKDISGFINKVKPSWIYFHHPSDIHSDHKIAFEAIYSCTKNFRYPYIEKILLFETLSETEFSVAFQNNSFVPNTFNDITSYLDKKLELMKLYTTEQMEEPFPRATSTIQALARYRGSRIGVQYAEAFTLIFEKL